VAQNDGIGIAHAKDTRPASKGRLPMKPTNVLPDDPGLPGLRSIRERGLRPLLPGVELDDEAIELTLCGYSRGLRATLEVRCGTRQFTVKCYARDPSAEAGFYAAMGRAGLCADDSPVRVPRLLHWDPGLRLMAIGWLSGPTAGELIANGQGARAGDLAARWIRRAASLPLRVRAASGADEILARTPRWTAALGAAHRSLGTSAESIAALLSASVREEPAAHVVNGRFYVRHVIDLGRGVGIIDWEHFGRGALEIDAGMFLATVWRSGRHEDRAREAARAEEAFVAGTSYLLDERRLAWYRAGALLSLAYHMLARRKEDWQDKAGEMLGEALRAAERAGSAPAVGRASRAGAVAEPCLLVETAVEDSADDGAAGARRHSRPDRSAERSAAWFSGLDLSLMRALWSTGEATVEGVAESLGRPLTASTVGERLSHLVEEGVVSRRVEGRESRYRATVGQAEVQRSIVEGFASFADELFEGDVAALVCQLVRARDVKAEDLGRVIALLKARERELEGERK
jgi:predicted transcriptional regulator